MATTDPLILWETAAIRESASRRHADGPAAGSPRSRKRDAWVTLRDAHYETGLPVETLRKWARRNHVPSEIRHTEYGERRVVDLVAVEERARNLGRPLRPVPLDQRTEFVAERAEETGEPEDDVLDLRARAEPAETVAAATPATLEDIGDGADEAGSPEVAVEVEQATDAPTEPEPQPMGEAPPGTMIIPIAAWDKMLMQLGNLHEAGQQLAEARERAAKAETEATFLKERVRDLRHRLEAAEPPPIGPMSDADASPPAQPEAMWRYLVRGWRERRR